MASTIIYFILLIIIMFSVHAYVASFYNHKVSTHVVLNNSSKSGVSFFKTIYKPKKSISMQKSKTNKSKKVGYSVEEIELEIKNYSRQLNRNLKTLDYISIMEMKAEIEDNIALLLDLLNLKESVQRELIINTQQINHYKSLLTK